jgi:hypothetical protein
MVSKKPLFASGGAYNILVFLCATNFEHKINLLNGKLKYSINIQVLMEEVSNRSNKYTKPFHNFMKMIIF